MVTARGSLTCPLSAQERAALRAAQERVARIFEQGITDEERAQILAELQRPPQARQASLRLSPPA